MQQTSQNAAIPISEKLIGLEELPQRVVPFGRDLEAGQTLDFHRHKRAQLVFASEGLMVVTTRQAANLVPPQRAVWMPAGIEHRIDARSALAMRSLYIRDAAEVGMSGTVRVFEVTPLLRELVIELVARGPRYEAGDSLSRIADVVIDQIAVQPLANLSLTLPTDSRAARVARALIDHPANTSELDIWASEVGSSKRTLTRLFSAQTGMTFQAWRQQCRLLRSMELLAAGHSVTSVALQVGYDGTSAFIAMFRRATGRTPSQYAQTLGTA